MTNRVAIRRNAVWTSMLLVVGLLAAPMSFAQTCGLVAGLTDCQTDADCIVVDRSDCCPCSSGGLQAAINRNKQDDLSLQLQVCCAAAGFCLDVYLCRDNLAAGCNAGKCELTRGVATPTPTPIEIPDGCNPASPACPDGTECYCCCGAFRCLSPAAPCCLLPCSLPPPTVTPTSVPDQCIGDCNGDGAVNIDELVLGVGIALGTTAVGVCPAFRCDENVAGVFVNCVVLAVNNALTGCPTIKPTPTASGTVIPTPILPHGHLCCQCENAVCTDFAWVEVEPACPQGCQAVLDAECEASCHGGPQSGPATCMPLTPCSSDADCDDGNGCTVDVCSINGCTHGCRCV